jgi:hypothetical protein
MRLQLRIKFPKNTAGKLPMRRSKDHEELLLGSESRFAPLT